MSDPSAAPGFFGNLRSLARLWRDIAAAARIPGTTPGLHLEAGSAEALRQQMRDCLARRGGEVSARARAAALGRTYLALDTAGRERFLHILADEFNADDAVIRPLAERLLRGGGEEERRQLRQALEPPRVRLLTQFNALPEGVKFLVDLRAELLGRRDRSLSALELDLKGVLAGWFDIGFLELKRITWESSASMLEKLMAYEAVHEIRGWADLKNRLEADRRCFAYFHPRMPEEPLIFVEIALVKGMADNVHRLLDETAPVEDARAADTAIFYSISNCQRGLAGISLGNFLIKRVVDSLRTELPQLTTFATLSPIPGFRAWLDRSIEAEGLALLTPPEREALAQGLAPVLKAGSWLHDPFLMEAVKGPLLRLCAHYLIEARGAGGRALDPVAHFHLVNGARMERLNWAADLSIKGVNQSAGLMINYLYRLDEIEENHEAYTGDGKVKTSPALSRLLR
ncbi:MAG TPA: malonyl-CoA decarboxylase [Stellaceae bacterium]|nr:malonyl-CoA decarboxylase [Stellaceae bacterium]